MMCTECFHVAVPDTVLPGSDFVELLAWVCFGLPGLLYCWWRHINRIKVCPHCHGRELLRESRASAARRPPDAAPSSGQRIRNLAGPVRWPGALASPRERLRSGSVGALLLAASLLAWTLGMLDLAPADEAFSALCASALLCASWLLHQGLQIARQRPSVARQCRAWDQNGRTLHIEQA
jgi:hypothetical protein